MRTEPRCPSGCTNTLRRSSQVPSSSATNDLGFTSRIEDTPKAKSKARIYGRKLRKLSIKMYVIFVAHDTCPAKP